MPERNGFLIKKKENILALCMLFVSALIIAILAFGRNFFTFGTESDYFQAISEAQRILNGEPLLIRFHPPLYPAILALVQLFFRDWFLTGLAVSLISSIVVIGSSLLFFYWIGGKYASLGSAIALITSTTFLSYSALSTSDIFFLALYSAAILITAYCIKIQTWKVWSFLGLIIGFAILTRTNGLTLLVLLALPFFHELTFKQKLYYSRSLLAGILIPLFAWVLMARITGSPVTPTNTYANLALTYFAQEGDGIGGESRRYLEKKFSNVKEVVSYDPSHMAKSYVKDIYSVAANVFRQDVLLAYPVNLFALPGILFLLLSRRSPVLLMVIAATLCQVALVNFKTFEARYYLFLIPLFGAGAGICLEKLIDSFPSRRAGALVLTCVAPIIVVIEASSIMKTHHVLHRQDEELGEVVPVARGVLEPNAILVARKDHLGYYANRRSIRFPQADSLTGLKSALQSIPNDGPLYVYYGLNEQNKRPGLHDLKHVEKKPAWLEAVAKSKVQGGWILYRYLPGVAEGK